MKAVVFKEHGGPEVLQHVETVDPQIKANEVLIEVRACALNHLDVWARKGLPGITIPLPHILGNDIAGVVREAGELVTWVKAGDEVLLQPGVSCGHCIDCLRGQDNLARNMTFWATGALEVTPSWSLLRASTSSLSRRIYPGRKPQRSRS